MTQANTAQAEFWASGSGTQWIVRETLLDAMMAPILARVLDHITLQPGETVLDIGCGTGASCLAAAALVGPRGHVTGLDIAAQLLDRAEGRAKAAGMAHITHILADAQTHAFAPASVDGMISRFGVMFFEDPVAAFANMARALKPGGRLVFAAWGPAAQVPWFSIPTGAAIARFGKPAPVDPFAPGPLAFQDPDRVTKMMQAAGLKDVRAVTETVHLTPSGTLAEVATFATRVGPAARILAELSVSEADAIALEGDVKTALAGFETDQGVRIPVAVHFFCAGV